MERRSRRNFLKVSGAGALTVGLAAGCAAPATPPTATAAAAPAPAAKPKSKPAERAAQAPRPTAQPTTAPVQAAPPPAPTQAARPVVPPESRVLVMVQLGGGDDGLNLLAPYGNGLYYDLRPKVAIAQSDVLPLNNEFGLHPSVKAFKRLYDEGKFAMIQGVGYPNPSRSHFRSMDIWHTARTDANADQGWLGAFMAEVYKVGDSPFQCVNIGNAIPKAMLSPHAPAAAVQDATTFQFLADRKLPTGKDPLLKTFGQMYAKPGRKLPTMELVSEGYGATVKGVEQLGVSTEKYQPATPYPQHPFAKALQNVAQMIAANLGTRVFYVSLGGFDTHSNQKPAHATLLTQVSNGLAAFQKDLEQMGKADNVLVLGFSEFGRRVKENGSGGTDHGAAGPMFAIGNAVKPGLYGEVPSLTDLDDGDLRHTVDFRSVYATVLENWFRTPSQQILGGSYERLGFLG
ncbi:MAG: DUF1501 domain-containing protein [Chloroflexi bacterium]|nr:DUF1501 domain-containing protein [Chloroflexota bacterium]